jgi:hypothetical protein
MKTILAAVLALFFACAAQADTTATFVYTGTPFTETFGSGFGTTEITGTFISDTNFSFTDGSFTWTPQNTQSSVFDFSKDSSGNIVSWNIDLFAVEFIQPDIPDFNFELISSSNQGVGQDSSRATRMMSFGPEYFVVSDISGTWVDPPSDSTAPSSTPESGTLPLGLTGISMLIGVSVWKKVRA